MVLKRSQRKSIGFALLVILSLAAAMETYRTFAPTFDAAPQGIHGTTGAWSEHRNMDTLLTP